MKRYHLIFLCSILLFLGSIVTTLSAIQERDEQLRGYIDASLESELPFRVPRLGVNAQLFQYDQQQLEQNFILMEKAHVTWVRQFIHWSVIEAEPTQFDWEATDRIFTALKSHPNLEPVIVFTSTPAWARQEGSNASAPPANNKDFANFAEAFANRYGDSVDFYQIWDEPNLTAAWGGQEPRAVEYTAMLAEAYKHIYAVDTNAIVIAAALAPTTETGPKNISDIVFLRDMYAAGAKDYMDATAAKPYGFSASPIDRTVSPDELNFSRIIALREEMVRNGDAKKALWASEWGWNTLPETWQGEASIWGNVSDQQQIDYTISALDRAEREWPWLGGLIINQWQPDASFNDPIWGFTLMNQSNQPTPLLNALQTKSDSQLAQNGLFPAVNPFTSYSGVWTFGSLGADIGWVQDSQFQFRFNGTDISLLLRQDNYTAYLYPQIDGDQANAVPTDASGNSYIVLTSSSQKPETNLIPVARNLRLQPHTLHVVADRGWDRWAIAGFGVSSGNLSLPFEQRISVGWITVFLSAISAIITVRQPARQLLVSVFDFISNYLNTTAQFVLSVISSIALLIGMLFTWGDGSTNILRHEPVSLILAIATSGLIKLQPGIILTAVSAIILLVVFYNHIYIGLALTIFWSPFFLFPVELYRFSFPLVEVILIITVLAWVLRVCIGYAHSRQSLNSRFPRATFRSLITSLTFIDYAVLLWVTLGLLSLLWVKRLPEAVTELRTILIEPFLFYVVLRTSRVSKKQLLFIVDALVIAGLLVAIIGLWQYVNGEAIITAEGGSRRLASVYGSPNNVALILGRCIPFALAFVLISIDWRRRIFYACVLIPMGIALLLTQSVGGLFIGVPISVAFVCFVTLRRRARFLIVGITLIVIIGFFVSLQSQRFSRMLDFSSGTNFYRIRAWSSAINIIQDHPLTGLGLDQFLYEFRGRYILPDAWQEPNLSHPHNIILDFWIRLGLSGVVLLISLQLVFWQRMLALYRIFRQRDLLSFSLAIGGIGSMINLLGHGMIDNSIFVIDLSYVFVLLLTLTHLENARSIDEPLI